MPPPRNSRRTTLGPVNMNRRQTLGGARTPTKTSSRSKKPSKKGRVSMLPRMGREGVGPPSPGNSIASKASRSDRRQTILPHSNAVKSDPRPIGDKGFQQSAIQQLYDYLTSNGYDYHITEKSLSRPSGKDFANIVGFMLRKVDPTFQNGAIKFEDEVVMHFKGMGYPYPLSKTALVAAGSPHTWPALLAALAWLMEHLKCLEADQSEDEDIHSNDFRSLDELEKKTDRRFFAYLEDAYGAFLSGDQQRSDQLVADLSDTFERDNVVIEGEIERVTDINAAIVEKMNHLSQQTDQLPDLAKKREDYATDLEQFEDLVGKLDEHKEALARKVQERTVQLQETNADLESLTAKIESLSIQIKEQELSVEDIIKMKSERARLKEMLEKACALREVNKDALWKVERELNEAFEELESVVDDYNSKVSEIALFRDGKVREADLMMSVRRDVEKYEDPDELLQVKHDGEVRPFFASLVEEVTEESVNAKEMLQSKLDQLEACEEAWTEATDNNKILEDKIAKREEILKSEKEQNDAALSVRTREVKAIEEKIDELRDPAAIEEQIAKIQRQCTTLEALQLKHQEETVSAKRAVQEEINAALDEMSRYDEQVQMKLNELKQYKLEKMVLLRANKVESPDRL